MFDPEQEQVDASPLWFCLPGLPLHLWMEDVFRHIGNALGTFLTFDKSHQTTGRMVYTRILVHMDTTDGLLEHINIQWMNSTRRQTLDYEGVPFRCRGCHKVRHLFNECPLNGKVNRKAPRKEPPVQASSKHGEQPQHADLEVQAEPSAKEATPSQPVSKSEADLCIDHLLLHTLDPRRLSGMRTLRGVEHSC